MKTKFILYVKTFELPFEVTFERFVILGLFLFVLRISRCDVDLAHAVFDVEWKTLSVLNAHPQIVEDKK